MARRRPSRHSRPSKHTRPARPLLGGGHAADEVKADGRWVVRTVSGSAATKEYRCPGCDHPIPAGTPHLVCWPAERSRDWAAPIGVGERRHWHTSCWRRRS